MTKKKPGKAEFDRETLRAVALLLESSEPLPPRVAAWVANGLRRIADGEDGADVFGVKRRPGERKPDPEQDLKLRAALSLVAALRQPPPDGPGLSLEAAIAEAAGPVEEGGCGYSANSLETFWKHRKELRETSFVVRRDQRGGPK